MTQPVGVVFGGPSPEHDVSVITGLQASRTLLDRAHDVLAFYWSKVGDWWVVDPGAEASEFAEGVPNDADELRLALGREGGFSRHGAFGRRTPVDVSVVVNCCHGGPGEDGTLQAALDLAGIRYTGPSARAAAVGMDKLAFSGMVGMLGLTTLPRQAYRGSVTKVPSFPPPYIVKPRFGGSSIGISVVADDDSLRALVQHSVHLRAGAVVEPYLEEADDVNIAIRGFPELELSAIEKPLRASDSSHILGFADKYTPEEGMAGAEREVPAALPPAAAERIKDSALTVALHMPVRGIARLDFLLHESTVYVNEINTIPGSLAKYLWVDPSYPFHDLLESMISEARERPVYQPSIEGADGALLRSAGAIASKLR